MEEPLGHENAVESPQGDCFSVLSEEAFSKCPNETSVEVLHLIVLYFLKTLISTEYQSPICQKTKSSKQAFFSICTNALVFKHHSVLFCTKSIFS